jgi:hypothetical protein
LIFYSSNTDVKNKGNWKNKFLSFLISFNLHPVVQYFSPPLFCLLRQKREVTSVAGSVLRGIHANWAEAHNI